MSASPVVRRSEIRSQNITKVVTAFSIGLVTMFGSAVVYSNLQQRRELVPAVQPASLGQSVPSAEPPAPVTTRAQSLPENSPRIGDQQQATSSITAVSPELSARNTVVGGSSAEIPSTRLHSPNMSGSGNTQSVSQRVPVSKPIVSDTSARPDASQADSKNLPQFGPFSNVALPPPSIPTQESKGAPDSAQQNFSVKQLQRADAEPPQIHPEPVSSVSLSKTVTIPATTTLAVRLSEALSSDRNQPGDTFRATLVSPLVVDGYLLAEEGAAVLGRVEASRRGPLLRRKSELSVSLTEISAWDGQRTRVETGWRQVKGTRNPLTNTAKMTTGLMAEAKTAALPAGAQLTFILTAPLAVTGTRQR